MAIGFLLVYGVSYILSYSPMLLILYIMLNFNCYLYWFDIKFVIILLLSLLLL